MRRDACGSLACLLAVVPAVLAAPAAAGGTCEQWRTSAADQKRAVIQAALGGRTDAETEHPSAARCDAAAESGVAREVDRACRAGGVLEDAFEKSVVAWRFTCVAVRMRAQAGERTGPATRREIRTYWDRCTQDGGDATSCLVGGRARFVDAIGTQAGRDPACTEFLALADPSQRIEAEGRITGRAAVMPDVAACMRERTGRITGVVSDLCRAGVDAAAAWDQALDQQVERCTSRDPDAF